MLRSISFCIMSLAVVAGLGGCQVTPPLATQPAPPVTAPVVPALSTAPAPVTPVPASPPLATLIETSFTDATVPVTPSATAQLSGAVSHGWRDDSGWATLSADYRIVEEDGLRFLRLDLRDVIRGQLQLVSDLPAASGAHSYQVSVTARISNGSEAQIGIRQRSAPWQMLASVHPGDAGWRRYSCTTSLTRTADAPLGIWVVLGNRGTLDLANLTCVEIDPQVAEQEHLTRIGGADPTNLVRVSRFPLGLPSGWMISRDLSDGDVLTAAADPAMPGPSGVAALRVSCSWPTYLLSAPFDIVRPALPHQLALAIRGDWRGRLELLEGDQVLATCELNAEQSTWKRVVLPFTPTKDDLANGIHVLRLSGRGTLWLDSLQVHAGSTVKPYAAQRVCEVELALPAGAAAGSHCQFSDETPQVRWSTTGAAAGSVLRWSITDQDGTTWPLADSVLSGGMRQDGVTTLPIPAERHGALRIQAQVVRGTESQSATDELVLLRLPRPVAWGVDAPHSPFGIHVLSTNRHLAMVKALGYNWVRLHDAGFEYTGWSWLEQNPGEWSFRDRDIARYREHHLEILGQLGTAPRWASRASTLPALKNGYFARFFQPLSQDTFANYVRTVVGRHHADIQQWFVWNEPWISSFWAYDLVQNAKGDRYLTSAEPQRDYVNLLATGYRAAKEADPQARIIGLNTTDYLAGGDHGSDLRIAGVDWTAGAVAAGALKHCDAIDYHSYIGAGIDGIVPAVQAGFARATTGAQQADGKLDRPVLLSEGAPFIAPESVRLGGYQQVTLGHEQPDHRRVAQRLVRYEVGALSCGIERIFLYSTHCHQGLQNTPQNSILVAADGSPHPAAVALAALHRVVEGLTFSGTTVLAPGTIAYRFTAEGRAAAVVLDDRDGHPPALDRLRRSGVEVADLWGNPCTQAADGDILLLTAPGGPAALAAALSVGQ